MPGMVVATSIAVNCNQLSRCTDEALVLMDMTYDVRTMHKLTSISVYMPAGLQLETQYQYTCLETSFILQTTIGTPKNTILILY